jgi:HEAT repeat protein
MSMTLRRSAIVTSVCLLVCLSAAQGQKPDSAGKAHAVEVLKAGAADRDPDTRRQVALALSLGRSTAEVISMLQALVKDGDSLVRQAALDTVGELGDAKLAPAAETALNDDVAEVVFAAARALYRLHDSAGKSMLIAVVEKEQKAESNPLRVKLRNMIRRMKTPRSALFLAVEQGAGLIPVPGMGEGISAMSALLNDENFSARATALLLLSGDKSADVRALIEQAFSDDDWSMRAAAVQLVAQPQNARWRPRLLPALDDLNKKVRFRAAAIYLRVTR